MSPMYVALVALGGTIAGAAGTLLTKLLPSRGETAEASATIAEVALQLIEPQHEQLIKIQAEMVLLRANQREMLIELARLKSDIAQLTNQLVELGHVPVTHL
tara:strand:+ start:346 stop:651 length:306 start_codon:yes stop_codon:yes gene_type:complete